jgi:hypothetical protein
MGLFSKTPKANPRIVVDGIAIEFHLDHEWWGFTYRGMEFWSCELLLTLPTRPELDRIVDSLELLMPELKERLKKGLEEWGDYSSKTDDGESYRLDVKQFYSEGTVTISWSDGASWGDLGVDFIIKDGAILDEQWGD